jgi:group I intron endonuclease
MDTTKNYLPTPYQQFIHLSKYARYNDELGRRETWEETVDRYIEYFKSHTESKKDIDWVELKNAILNLEVMPSMRCMMTAGKALEKDQVAGYNCSYIPIDNLKSFDEIMYILCCFHPETMVKTKNGPRKISELSIGDEVLSFNEKNKSFVWKPITNVIETPSSHIQKYAITLENGEVVKCTHNHLWLTSNRGWVKTENLDTKDDIISPKYFIYKIINKTNGKSYIGFTGQKVEHRFKQHMYEGYDEYYTSHFKRAIRKYGKKVWTYETIDYAYSITEAKKKEKLWIKNLDTLDNGYNSTKGGDGANGYNWTNEQKLQASKNAYKRTDHHIEQFCKRMKLAQVKVNKTRKTEEYKSAQRLRNLKNKNPAYGKKWITNGIINKQILLKESLLLGQGWRLGRTINNTRNSAGRFV